MTVTRDMHIVTPIQPLVCTGLLGTRPSNDACSGPGALSSGVRQLRDVLIEAGEIQLKAV